MIIREIICVMILFLVIYLIIYLDHKINNKCNCKENNVSIKIPFLVSIITYILFKLLETNIYSYINGLSVIKQDIITDMADF